MTLLKGIKIVKIYTIKQQIFFNTKRILLMTLSEMKSNVLTILLSDLTEVEKFNTAVIFSISSQQKSKLHVLCLLSVSSKDFNIQKKKMFPMLIIERNYNTYTQAYISTYAYTIYYNILKYRKFQQLSTQFNIICSHTLHLW